MTIPEYNTITVSIIIPCYNQGVFLLDALQSLEALDKNMVEIIIVNDGSTDQFTNEYIGALDKGKYKVVVQQNKGLAAARNTAIKIAKGKYIIPLDADNKLHPVFIMDAIGILDQAENVTVVYGNARYFGAKNGDWIVGEYNLQKLMIENYIDACAMIRKEALIAEGLYDENMRYMGWEDWELWLRLSFKGYQFSYVNKVFFDYRVLDTSMSNSMFKSFKNYEKPNFLVNYLQGKYPDQLGLQWMVKHVTGRFRKNPVLFIIKLFLQTYMPKTFNQLLKKNKIRIGL